MFIGHYAVALWARKDKTLPSLATMFIAVQLLDLLWPVFVLTGLESFEIEVGNTALTPLHFIHYPYSHSLLMSIFWAALFAMVYYLFTKNKNGSLVVGVLVISHWILDLITHAPDLPLSPFSDMKVGLGMWNMPVIEIVLETGLFVSGALLYYRTVRPKRKIAYGALILAFLAIHFLNLFGPPPPSVAAVAWSANLMWLFVLWAWWIEKE
jgi:membrane-bound metal-dependent hydrolase YbcI (DUF457 family)